MIADKCLEMLSCFCAMVWKGYNVNFTSAQNTHEKRTPTEGHLREEVMDNVVVGNCRKK